MADAGDQTRESGGVAAARGPIEQENPAVPPPPPRRETAIANLPPRSIGPRGANLAEKNLQSLSNSFRSAALTPRERESRLKWLFNLMARSEDQEDATPFQQLISSLNGRQRRRIASLLTSDSDDSFLKIARNTYGSKHIQKVLGKSDDVDNYFADAILRCFEGFMTDKFASFVVVQGMRVFSQERKTEIWSLIHHHAINLACDQYGYIALNAVMEDVDCRNYLLDIVAHNALLLSYDVYGNFVVQRVLDLNDVRCTYNIAASLSGNCVELAFQRYGSYIVERLLETEESRFLVVTELFLCDGHRLMRLARSKFGNFVVGKALRTLTRGDHRLWVLVDKLMPFLHLLRMSPGIAVAAFLESLINHH